MNETTSINSKSEQAKQGTDPVSASRISFPLTAIVTSRKEHQCLPLEILVRKKNPSKTPPVNSVEFFTEDYWDSNGNLDEAKDLQGHMFITGPVGSFESKAPNYQKNRSSNDQDNPCGLIAPTQDGSISVLNGDGMIYRLDFHAIPDLKSTDSTALIEKPGKAFLSCEIAKTPDYFIDKMLYKDSNPEDPNQENCKKYSPSLRFINLALGRISPFLGLRNALNTAFVPLPPSRGSNDPTRLVATWDVGRPYEIDPRSLKLAYPIGWYKQWKFLISLPQDSSAKLEPKQEVKGLEALLKNWIQDTVGEPVAEEDVKYNFNGPFYTLLTAAHPQFDADTREFFSFNATKSVRQLLWFNRIAKSNLRKWVHKKAKFRLLRFLLFFFIVWFLERVNDLLEWWGLFGRYEVFLLRWQVDQGSPKNEDYPKTDIQRWRLVDKSCGKPIFIKQALHQVGLTKKYILVADVAFKLPIESYLPGTSQSPILKSLTSRLFSFLTYPQLWYLPIYIVRREDLKDHHPNEVPDIKVTRVKPGWGNFNLKTLFKPGAAIHPETAHFLTDYTDYTNNDDSNHDDDDSSHRITIHASHTIAADPTEFIRKQDKYFKDNSASSNRSSSEKKESYEEKMTLELRKRAGMIVNTMDASRLCSWTIDAKTGRVLSKKFADKRKDSQRLWYLGIYAWRGSDQCGHSSPNQFKSIYWLDQGVWPDLSSQMVYNLYRRHKNRVVSLKEMDKVLAEGRPTTLVRSYITRKRGKVTDVKIVDRYEFPRNFFSMSPQFIPKGKDEDSDSDSNGYLVCSVLWDQHIEDEKRHTEKKNEFWIFDASCLSAGPLYRLRHQDFKIGVTIHSTWIRTLGTPPKRDDYTVAEDYQELMESMKHFVTDAEFSQVRKLFFEMYKEYKEEYKPYPPPIEYKLKPMYINNHPNDLPKEGKELVVVAKNDNSNSYYVCIFDAAEKKILDTEEGEFLPDAALAQAIDTAIEKGEKEMDKSTRIRLILKIASSLCHPSEPEPETPEVCNL